MSTAVIFTSTFCAVLGTLRVVFLLCQTPHVSVKPVRDYFSLWALSLLLVMIYDCALWIMTGHNIDVWNLRPLINRPVLALNTWVLVWRLQQYLRLTP